MLNKLLIAAAGSGKTTHIINEASRAIHGNVLITTYTIANANEIKRKIVKVNGSIPPNLVIQTWFSLLIQHGIKPYQDYLFDERIKGMLLVNRKSGLRYYHPRTNIPIYWGENNFHKYYFNSELKVYSDKLSKLVWKINEESEGRVIKRLTEVYTSIFIDECQDLAGYDLEILKALSLKSDFLCMVCDPRQVTYLTHLEAKNRPYREGLIENYILEKCEDAKFQIDTETLSDSYRSNQLICTFSNKLFPNLPDCNTRVTETTNHDGVFLVDRSNISKYLIDFNPVQLRWNNNSPLVNEGYSFYNFGESKGMTFDRVLIFPTQPMLDWLLNHDSELKNSARARFYVGITRARYSVGIVCDTSLEYDMDGVLVYLG